MIEPTKDEFVESFTGLARAIAREWGGSLDLEDREQSAMVGLLVAYEMIDWSKVEHQGGLVKYVRKSVRKELRKQSAATAFATTGSERSLTTHSTFHYSSSLDALDASADAESFQWIPDAGERRTSADALNGLRKMGLTTAQAEAWLTTGELSTPEMARADSADFQKGYDALDLAEPLEASEEEQRSGSYWPEEESADVTFDSIVSTWDEVLTPRQREVMELYYVDALLSDTHVAAVLGISQQTATTHRQKAEESLREAVI